MSTTGRVAEAITQAHINGPFEPGDSFVWSSYGFAVTSQIYEMSDLSRTLWGGTAGGITGIHEWLFAESDGGVRVTTNESFAGEPVSADVPGMQGQLDASLVAWLDYLKSAAEGAVERWPRPPMWAVSSSEGGGAPAIAAAGPSAGQLTPPGAQSTAREGRLAAYGGE